MFQKAFRRKLISGTEELTKVCIYTHQNPIHHGYTNKFGNYEWSSYSTITDDCETRLAKSKVLEWFGGVDAFVEYSRKFQMHNWTPEAFYLEEFP